MFVFEVDRSYQSRKTEMSKSKKTALERVQANRVGVELLGVLPVHFSASVMLIVLEYRRPFRLPRNLQRELQWVMRFVRETLSGCTLHDAENTNECTPTIHSDVVCVKHRRVFKHNRVHHNTELRRWVVDSGSIGYTHYPTGWFDWAWKHHTNWRLLRSRCPPDLVRMFWEDRAEVFVKTLND